MAARRPTSATCSPRSPTTPRPRFSGRLGVSKGIGPASLGLGTGIGRAGGDTIPFLGLELSVRATPIGVHRTPVVEVYARADLGFADAGRTGTFLGGLRVVLDLL